MLYSVAALESGIAKRVSPLLIFINKAKDKNREDYIVRISSNRVDDASELCNEFKELLHNKLKEIFDINTPFTPTDDIERCKWCDFRKICERDNNNKD